MIGLFLGEKKLPLEILKSLKKKKLKYFIIDLSKNNVKEKELSGLDIQSATQWSTHPSSILGWLVARYQGGMSNEKYNGNKYPQLVLSLIHI